MSDLQTREAMLEEAGKPAQTCKATVEIGPCSRKATKDGFCWQHHPEAEKDRRAKKRQRFARRMIANRANKEAK